MAQRVERTAGKKKPATGTSSTSSAAAPSTPTTPEQQPPQQQPRTVRLADGSEARMAVRIPHRAPAQLMLWPAGPRTAPIDVQVVDYSRVGVGIVAREIILIGQKYVVRESEVTRGSNTCLYQAVRCDRRSDGRYSVGLRICEDQMDLEPRDEPPRRLSRRMQWAYFIFALIGAAAVLAMALINHFR
jgi:hypothetical protein